MAVAPAACNEDVRSMYSFVPSVTWVPLADVPVSLTVYPVKSEATTGSMVRAYLLEDEFPADMVSIRVAAPSPVTVPSLEEPTELAQPMKNASAATVATASAVHFLKTFLFMMKTSSTHEILFVYPYCEQGTAHSFSIYSLPESEKTLPALLRTASVKV